MPELPEVETIKRGLSKLLPGKTIKKVTWEWPKSFPNSQADIDRFLIHSKIISVKRRAKVLMINLDSGYSLIIHLKMTGQLVFVGQKRFGAGHPNESLIGKLPDKSTRVILDFEDSKLYFNDQRKFGWMKLVPTIEIPKIDFFKKVGPEPLSKNFTLKIFKQRLQIRSNSSVKSVLLDQTTLAGVGNIYADEALWAVKIHPNTLVKNLTNKQIGLLLNAIKEVLRLSIKKGGSTDKNYVDADGKKGNYLKFAKVFRREGQPCPRCGIVIEKIKVANRGTHYCPKCQKA